MKRALFATTAIGILAAASAAVAADLPRPAQMPVKAPAYVLPPVYNWTGLYIGVNGGGAFGRSRFDFPGGLSNGLDVSGGLIGGTIGYNYQTGPWVFGLEGDIGWADINGSASCLGGILSCQTRNDWLGTARGRVGYAFDRFLPYLTGGAAFGNIKAGAAGFGSVDTGKTGWTLGGGIEYGLAPNWTAKIEYLYVDLGSVDCGIACGVAPTSNAFTTSVVRAGINYRF